MGRRLLVAGLAATLFLPRGSPALAKGGHGRVTVFGSGLHRPITLLDEDAMTWFGWSGLFQLKWDQPNISGHLDADADLGPAYHVRASFDCGGPRSVFQQTLFPYAPGGPQVLTPAGVRVCGGTRLHAGYYPAPDGLLDMLVHKGFPETAPGATRGEPNTAPKTRGRSGVGIAIGLALLAILFAGNALFHRRRVRAAR